MMNKIRDFISRFKIRYIKFVKSLLSVDGIEFKR